MTKAQASRSTAIKAFVMQIPFEGRQEEKKKGRKINSEREKEEKKRIISVEKSAYHIKLVGFFETDLSSKIPDLPGY